jgi:hypothetical protein
MAATWFAGVALSDTRISFEGQSVAVRGARAYVEEDGEVVRRESLSRVLPGRLRDVLRGPDHPRELFLFVEGPSFHFVVPCHPSWRAEARSFASAVCVAGSRTPDAPVRRSAGPGFPRSALRSVDLEVGNPSGAPQLP